MVARITTCGEFVSAIEIDARLRDWRVEQKEADRIEIRRDDIALMLVWPPVWSDPDIASHVLQECRVAQRPIVAVEAGQRSPWWGVDPLCIGIVDAPTEIVRLTRTLEFAHEMATLREQSGLLARARYQNRLLIDIGRALSKERDHVALLDLILQRARDVTGADAGSVYEVEGDPEAGETYRVRFIQSQNDSIEMPSPDGFTLPVTSSSIVGACVLSGEVINIPDLYGLDEPGTGNNPWGFVHDRSFDRKHSYQTRSMITVPMVSARGKVIGVIQLINRCMKESGGLGSSSDLQENVVPFDEVSIDYATTLASQAGIALENALLYEEVKALFEGFVHASVSAIEARDPTTSGHSVRVADLTVGLAKAVDRVDSGRYENFSVSRDLLKQIEYAALLHDFGKVGVRERVLVKSKKLYEHERELIEARFQMIQHSIDARRLREKVALLLKAHAKDVADQLASIDIAANRELVDVEECLAFIRAANEPTVLETGGFDRIAMIAERTFTDFRGVGRRYLEPAEIEALQINRGSLTGDERAEIESHVSYTFAFLNQIPWGKTYGSIPEIAGAHHEKLDGSGYPQGLRDPEIPVPAKMMTIADIYDALTASDRPYKKAVPPDRALDILGCEVKSGKLDDELFRLFVDSRVYQLV